MKQTLEKLTDTIEEHIPEGYNFALFVFPDGDGRVDIVTNAEQRELAKRLLGFAKGYLLNKTFDMPNDEKA